MINHQYKFLFIHVPRTGGTSIESFFNSSKNNRSRKHWSLNDWEKELSHDVFARYFKFSFVRNPWDSIISKYLDIWFTAEFPGGPIGEKSGKSLRYFLDNYETPKHEGGETFHDYSDPKDLDFIGRFENRVDDINYISKKIGVFIDPAVHHRKIQARKNNSRRHYSDYYDDYTRDLVSQIYARDIEHFGYKFGQ